MTDINVDNKKGMNLSDVSFIQQLNEIEKNEIDKLV